jgi:hypothetical protein
VHERSTEQHKRCIDKREVLSCSFIIHSPTAVSYQQIAWNAPHPLFTYEEDERILAQAGLNWTYVLLVSHDNMEIPKWVDNDTNKNFVYEYHKTFLKMMNSVDAPRSHRLLKAPIHLMYLDILMRHYPQASSIAYVLFL